MKINEAKNQIQNAVIAYLSKDETGNYIIPVEKQRPIFLEGPPGIGKTAVIAQIVREMGIGLLSYSMTHHTRQSALGLPFIARKIYNGKEYAISEYTMSEIISSIYRIEEETGVSEGILFIDEINCVSETLAPVMLQFLQYKSFGMYNIPDGWIVVTAGNPPEYNNSVREFDVATWDRLKRIKVDPDFEAWKEYAYKVNVHPAILSYLEIKKEDFYRIESTIEGKSFVTARGWDDLSQMIYLYEKNNLPVDIMLISQYIQHEKTARSFANYYDLWNKYKSDYQINDILSGKASEEIKNRCKAAKFDERLSFIGLILDGINTMVNECIDLLDINERILSSLRKFKAVSANTTPVEAMTKIIRDEGKRVESGVKAGNISHKDKIISAKVISVLESLLKMVTEETDASKAFNSVKKDYDKRIKDMKKNAESAKIRLSNAFKFFEEVYSEGTEMNILVSEITKCCSTSKFISRYGCDEYFAHNKEQFFFERNKQIMAQIDDLTLE